MILPVGRVVCGSLSVAFDVLIWDLDDNPTGNLRHIADHGVTQDEVAEVLRNAAATDVSHSLGLPVAFGETRGSRHLIVVYEVIDDATVYPVTAYDVPRRKRR